MTTFFIPLLIISGTQGGVCLFVWQHGSRLQKIVAPVTFSVAFLKALTSACAAPYFLWKPLPIIFAFLTITTPTKGFGLTNPLPFLASEKHCLIQDSLLILTQPHNETISKTNRNNLEISR